MQIYNFPQHQFDENEVQQIDNILPHWADMTHTDRQAFIDSINIDTNNAWIEVRAGKFTASTANQFLADSRVKSEPIGDSCKTLCHRVMAERTGWREQRNPYMDAANIKRGLCFEDVARKLAEKKLGEQIKECGFVASDDGMFGCSPDGLIMKDGKIDGIVEIKCPEPMSFYKQLMDCAKTEYQQQMQFSMNICDCPRAYFILYCPEVSQEVFVLKYTRGIAFQNKINERKELVKEYMNKVSAQIASGDINIPTAE